jgi:poly(3-hydroxyalkanoate) synthetase
LVQTPQNGLGPGDIQIKHSEDIQAMVLFIHKGGLALFVPDNVITEKPGEHRNLMASLTQGLAQFVEQMGRRTTSGGKKADMSKIFIGKINAVR